MQNIHSWKEHTINENITSPEDIRRQNIVDRRLLEINSKQELQKDLQILYKASVRLATFPNTEDIVSKIDSRIDELQNFIKKL